MLNDFRKIMKKYYGIEGIELNSNFKKDFELTSFDFVNLICFYVVFFIFCLHFYHPWGIIAGLKTISTKDL